jgi:IS30 family transposase
MAKHKDFTVATDVKVYFCDPQSPWQRGSARVNDPETHPFRVY